jgi:hypothetical protein
MAWLGLAMAREVRPKTKAVQGSGGALTVTVTEKKM